MVRVFKRKLVIAVILIFVVILIILLVVRGLKAPVQGSIFQTPPSQAEKTTPYSQPGIYAGKKITFKYPAHFKPEPTKLSGSYIELASYGSTDQLSKQINVGVYPGTISDDGGVSYRRKHPELYRETFSSRGLEFTKIDGTEDTFFIEHNGLLVSISTTGPSANTSGETLYIASSLKFKQ